MRIIWRTFSCLAALMGCCSLSAKAQILLTITPEIEATAPGGFVGFSGTLVNTSSNVVFLNGDNINLAGPGFTTDDSPFLNNAPLFLTANGTPDGSYTGSLFNVGTGTEPTGLYFGTFVITGGATDSSLDNVGSQTFGVDILPAASGVPEPGVYALICGFGMAGAAFLRRRRAVSDSDCRTH